MSAEKNTPPEERACGKTGFKNTKSGAGEQFLLVDCRGKAPVKGVCLFTDTGMAAYDVKPQVTCLYNCSRCSLKLLESVGRCRISRECLGHHRKGTPGTGHAEDALNVG